MDPRDDSDDDDLGPDDPSADAEPIIRELRAEMIRLQAQIDQIAAAAHDRAGEIAILRARLIELERRLDAIHARHRRALKIWIAIAAAYGSAVGLGLSYLFHP
jgi:hypothetical protein